MRKRSSLATLVFMLLVAPVLALSQAGQASRTLIVNGQPGQVAVVQTNGQITLTLPGATSTPAADPSASSTVDTGLSKGFLKAGIEAMSMAREWHSALANAIQNGFPIAADWLARYRNQAGTALRLASVAASTDSDQNAYQLLSKEFEK